MLKKIISILMVSVLIVTCFSGCKKEEEAGEALACAISQMPNTFDPQIVSTTVERMIAVNIFDGLFKLDENGKPQKCMAVDYSVSSDGLVYTFKIQKDTYYYISTAAKKFIESKDATIEAKITAEDFVFGIKRAILSETNSEHFELLSAVQNAEAVHNGAMGADSLGIRALDEYTLEITLSKPQKDFLYSLTQPVSFPCDEEFFELTGGRYGLAAKYIITNGGFYLSNVTEEKSVRIAKQNDYKGTHSAIPSAVGFYHKGDYDVGFFTDKEAIDEFGRKVQTQVLENISYSLVFNMSKDSFKNLSLRQGLVMGTKLSDESVDRFIPAYFGVDGKAERITYDAHNAHNTMIKAFEELKIKNISVDILCTKDYEKTAKNIVNSWQGSIGVELNGTVTVVEDKEFNSKLSSGDFELAIYPITVDSNKAVDFLSLFTSGNSQNIAKYSSEEYDRLWNDLKNNETQENALLCESYLLKNAIVLPLSAENTVFAMAKGTSGIYFCGDQANLYFYKGQKK